jgi:hypothetical protein
MRNEYVDTLKRSLDALAVIQQELSVPNDGDALERSVAALTVIQRELSVIFEKIKAQNDKDKGDYVKNAKQIREYVSNWRKKYPEKQRQYAKTHSEKKKAEKEAQGKEKTQEKEKSIKKGQRKKAQTLNIGQDAEPFNEHRQQEYLQQIYLAAQRAAPKAEPVTTRQMTPEERAKYWPKNED